MVSAVRGVTHTQPVAPITAVSRKPQQTKAKSSSDIEDTVHLSSAAQAHLSALRAAEEGAAGTHAEAAKAAARK